MLARSRSNVNLSTDVSKLDSMSTMLYQTSTPPSSYQAKYDSVSPRTPTAF
jgi:hypothetical protein